MSKKHGALRGSLLGLTALAGMAMLGANAQA